MRRAALLVVIILLLLIPAASAIQNLVITQPSANESLIAEERDFYVYGIFTGTVIGPGNMRIEVYPGDTVAGLPIRVIQSQVDPISNITNMSVINQTYCNAGYCSWWNNAMVPDLVESPGGILDPSNKLVVTNRYYLGLIQGGVTKGFDTNYTDSSGTPLVDLKAGNYTIQTVGLSGNFTGQKVNKTITLGLTSTVLGAFRPDANKAAITQYGITHNQRTYFDWFPGYFSDPDNSSIGFQSPRRWTPNNGIEVVNDRPGTLIDIPVVANNTMFIYNINSGSATYGVELAAILKYGLVGSPNTSFLYHDIGEPVMTYNDATAGVRTLNGIPTPFPSNKRLVLYRAEIFSPGSTSYENLFNPNDASTPKTMNFNPAAGISVPQGKEFVLYGATKPIASAVTATSTPYRFTIDNRITRINCTITDAAGNLVTTGMHDVNLSRLYNVGDPTRFNSLWEFGIEVTGLSTPGSFTISLEGLDGSGTPVAQTSTSLTATVVQQTSPPPVGGPGEGNGASSTPQSVVSPGAHGGATAVFTFNTASSAGTATVSSVTLTPSRDIGQVQCLVQPVTPGAALQLTGRDVAGYELISVNWINPDAIDHADIAFTVSKSWLDAHTVQPDQIVMMRYTGGQWVELPTRLDHTSGDTYNYVATTPGFSYFAIAGKSHGTGVTANVTQESLIPSGGTADNPGAPVATLISGPAITTPSSVTTTPVPAVTVSRSQSVGEIFFPSSGIPVITIVAWIVVLIIIVIVVLLVHRWWIRRQNPALFRKYD